MNFRGDTIRRILVQGLTNSFKGRASEDILYDILAKLICQPFVALLENLVVNPTKTVLCKALIKGCLSAIVVFKRFNMSSPMECIESERGSCKIFLKRVRKTSRRPTLNFNS